MVFILNVTEETKRLNNLKNYYKELDENIGHYYQVSLYGFKYNKYKTSDMIATHLMLARKVFDIENYSMRTSVEILKSEFNILKSQNRYAKQFIKDNIIKLVEEGIIEIKFENEGEGTLEERLKTELFKFKQTLTRVEETEKPMFFRLYEKHYDKLTAENAFDIMKQRVGNENSGVSVKFDYFSVFGAIANTLNAPFKDEYINEVVKYKDGLRLIKQYIKLYGASINYSGQEYISSKTACDSQNKSNNNGRVGVERVNQIDQSLRQDFKIFAHIKVRRYSSAGYKWNIMRCFTHEIETMIDMLKYELEKTRFEYLANGEPNENSIVDILPVEYLDDISGYNKIDQTDGFENMKGKVEAFAEVDRLELEEENKEVALNEENIEEVEIKPFNPLEDEIKEDKKISLAGTREKEKENKLAFMPNYTTKKPESTQLIEKEWHKISDAKKQYLILKETINRHKTDGLPYLDAFDVENAYKNENYSMINQIFNGNIKHQIITNEDFEQAIVNNPDKNLGYFKAEQKITKINFDTNPYEIEDDSTNKLINDVLKCLNVK